MTKRKHNASFRDPSGYVFTEKNILKRAVLPKYFEQYDALKKSGFFKKAIDNDLLIPHTETARSDSFIELTPERVPFISYPYEWSFDQYKHAALHTLKLQKFAVNNGFILKDASAFNVFFHNGNPILVDTLSFDFYKENTPWRAFQMFLSHFLGPLTLAHFHDASMLKMMQTHIDGIPIPLTSSLLPLHSLFSPLLLSNIHLVAKMERKFKSQKNLDIVVESRLSKNKHLKHLDALYEYIRDLKISHKTEWGNYYENIHYSQEAFNFKKQKINEWVSTTPTKKLVDVGGNDGTLARSVCGNIDQIIVGDIDPVAVNRNYTNVQAKNEKNILPLIMDFVNPSPAIGYNNTERQSLIDRLTEFKPDITLVLAIIHHLALSGNVPLSKIAHLFGQFSKKLIIEFPLRTDPMVELLLNRKREFRGHFDFYNLKSFEDGFGSYFKIDQKIQIPKSERMLYLMTRI